MTLRTEPVQDGAEGSNATPSPLCNLSLVGMLAALGAAGCAPDGELPQTGLTPAERADDFAVIRHVRFDGHYTQIPYYGDLWTPTWAEDGRLYLMFGDGTGMKDRLPTLLMDEPDEFDQHYVEVRPGWYKVKDPYGEGREWCAIYDCSKAYPLAPFTPAGLVALEGRTPQFIGGDGPDQCVVSRHIPYGNLEAFKHLDKPSSLVAVGSRFYAHMHYPPGKPLIGYVAFSDDQGRTWQKIEGSPWRGTSPFRVVMFINMGRAHRFSDDGYLYGLGVGTEVDLDPPRLQAVYLLRVRPAPSRRPDADPALDYTAYKYYAGLDPAGEPAWTDDPAQAVPVEGLRTLVQGSAMFHPDLKRYLFLSGFYGMAPGRAVGRKSESGDVPVGALFEAPAPWGPWRMAGRFPGGFVGSLIPKDVGPHHVYFTAAGGGGVTYALNIGRLTLDTQAPRVTPPRFKLIGTRKVEQIIGDVDFETLQPTRQRTETRFGLAHTDLGSPFEHNGKLWLLFGDSDPEAPGWDEYHDDAIAWTTARRIEDFRLHFLTDPSSGRGYLNPKVVSVENGTLVDIDLGALNVPVAGLGVGKSWFVWFTTDAAGRSLVARSDDEGRTFRKLYDFGRTHFIDIAVARIHGPVPGLSANPTNEWVLVFGSGDKQHPHVYLAATPLQDLRLGRRSAVRFLAAIDRDADGFRYRWSEREADAAPIFKIEQGQGPGLMSEVPHAWGFGEPLVCYSPALQLWVATYNAARRTIRLRTADRPWGPWSQSIVLFDPSADYGRGPAYGRYIGDGRTDRLGGQGELYGPYVIERFTQVSLDEKVKLYWLLSTWQPYTVVLMESILAPVP